MKHITTILALTLAGCASLAALPSTKLAAEWHVPSAGKNTSFSLIDAATGAVRIANMDAAGLVAWPHHLATGITHVSDAASGLELDKGEVLALTSPSSNRVVMLDLDAEFPYPRLLPALAGTGPSGVGGIGGESVRELLVASSQNGSMAGMLEAHNNLAAGSERIAQSNAPGHAFRRVQPVSAPGSTVALALVSESLEDGQTQASLALRDGSSFLFQPKGKFEGALEFATRISSKNHPAVPYLIGHEAGAGDALLMHFTLPLNLGSDLMAHAVTFPYRVAAVIPVLGDGTGPIDEGFLIVADDGSEARLMRVNTAGTGIEDAGQVFPADKNMALAGLAVVPGRGIVRLNSTAPGLPSVSYNAYQWEGSEWRETDAGVLPDLAGVTFSPASLLYYDGNPFEQRDARLLGVQSVRDWTSLASYPNAFPASVVRETFGSPAAGLVTSGNTTLTPPANARYLIANQAEPGVSIVALGDFERLLAPDLKINPDSGEYDETFQVTATFDGVRQRLLYRRDGGDWLLFGSAIPVAWTTTLQFMLEEKVSGARGPIVTREYTLAPEAIADLDSDGDGVLDYVEEYFGLNPFGGADSDGDGISDLDEILQGTNPAAPLDVPSSSLNLAPGGGMRIVATAIDYTIREIANAEDMVARVRDGSLLARAPVGAIVPALPDGGSRGAVLTSNSPPPFGELIAISTPLYFNVTSGGARDGRETIGFIPSDPPPVLDPGFTPTAGMSLADAANGWVAAAIAAAANTPLAQKRVEIRPASSAVAVLLEELVHVAAKSLLDADIDAPMPPLSEFSFLEGREADAWRAKLSDADHARLRSAGFSYRAALNHANDAGSSMSRMAMAIYQRHASVSASTPGMAMPIDALRIMLRGGSAPTGYAGAVSSTHLNDARTAYQAALDSLGAAFRPFDTWVIEIPASPSAPGVYQRVSDGADVVLLHPSGDRFVLDQGLGLRPGSQFSVGGFTDTPPGAGLDTMEVTRAALTFEPMSSDSDADGNLLDDEWEKFFFGSTGQEPFSEPHGDGFSLLQYFLDGIDPRTGAMPAGPAVALIPQLPLFGPSGAGGFTLDFLFPADYADRMAFVLERSETLAPGSYVEVPDVSIVPIGGDEFRAEIPEHEAPPGKAFYRVRLGLVP